MKNKTSETDDDFTMTIKIVNGEIAKVDAKLTNEGRYIYWKGFWIGWLSVTIIWTLSDVIFYYYGNK